MDRDIQKSPTLVEFIDFLQKRALALETVDANGNQRHPSSSNSVRAVGVRASVTQLNAYVANRIRVVAQLTAGWTWHYVRTSDNPADLITRGVSPQELADNMLWWTGPLFLQNDNSA
ncbi:unnamed protein product, partial [Iphiclides podalirius]